MSLPSAKACICLCMALLFFPFSSPAQVLAQARHTNDILAVLPTLQLTVGYDDDSRLDYWTPAWITLSNDGPDFSGVLSATTYTSPVRSGLIVGGVLAWSYKEPVLLSHGTQKQINISIPFYESPVPPRGVIAKLSDNHGKVIVTQTATPFTLSQSSLLIGILSDLAPQSTGFSSLSAVSLPDPTRSIEMATLNAGTFPDMAELLGNFDMIVLNDFPTSKLNATQLAALQTWVNQGGTLIEIGGSQWQRTLASLPAQLLPVVLQGIGTLPAGTNLLPAGGPTIAEIGRKPAPGSLQKSITISTATLPGKDDARQQAFSHLESVLTSGGIPLIVQAHQGQGIICYLAFDPTAEPLINWPGTIALWKGLVLRTPGDQALLSDIAPRYNNGPGAMILRGGLAQILQPGALFPMQELVFVLLGYMLLIGPVRLLIVRRLQRPTWSWRILLGSVVVFSLLTYGLASYQRGASINSISIIQLNQGGQFAHATTFYSVFIPGQGSSQVAIPSRTLAQPLISEPFQSDGRIVNTDYHIAFTVGEHDTHVSLPDIGAWAVHTIVSEGDQKLNGGLLSHLAFRGSSLVGTVTNTLDTALSDVYVLMPRGYAYIGHLSVGAIQQIDVPFRAATLNTNATLADQIARDNSLPVPYFPYDRNSQPRNDFQRHLAMLSALSGEGYSYVPCSGACSTHAIVSKHLIITSPPSIPKVNPLDSSDALLVAGAPATLIGWADQAIDVSKDATVDGASPRGTHDNLVQVPLNIDFSGPATMPTSLISSQVVDAQGNAVGIVSPSIYTMTTGSVTFEFTLPNVDLSRISNMTLTEPFTGQSVIPIDINHVQVRLYNWTTNSWDAISLNNYALTTANTGAYISSDGHILLQVVNRNASLGTLLFSKPSLVLNTTGG